MEMIDVALFESKHFCPLPVLPSLTPFFPLQELFVQFMLDL